MQVSLAAKLFVASSTNDADVFLFSASQKESLIEKTIKIEKTIEVPN